MTKDEILEEIKKCKKSPYYFATKYLIITNEVGGEMPFRTYLTEKEFNKLAKDYDRRRIFRKIKRR